MHRQARFAAAMCAICNLPLMLAHHSTAPYDLTRGTTIEGEMTLFVWENPHAHIYLDVRGEARGIEHWMIEIDGPGVLRRLGWKKDSLRAGDKIAISGARAKDGSFNLKASTVRLPGGKTLLAAPKIEN